MVASGIVFKHELRHKDRCHDILFLHLEQLVEILLVVGHVGFGKTDLYYAVCTEGMDRPLWGSSPDIGTSGVAKMNAHAQFCYVFVSRVLECYEDLAMAEFNAHQFHLVIRRVYQGYLTGR